MTGQYKLDMHIHTSETSSCGQIAGAEVARLYREAGYQGIMITDHYHKEYFEGLGDMKPDEKIERFLTGYRAARAEGERIGLDVLLGIEFRNRETDNDFLITGITEQFLHAYPDTYMLPLEQAIDLFHRHHMLVIQAHPVRFAVMDRSGSGIAPRGCSSGMIKELRQNPQMPVISQEAWKKLQQNHREESVQTPFVLQVCRLMCPDKLDGIEVYNGNIGWAQDPDAVQAILREHPQYIKTSASDFHELAHLARGGMILDRRVKTSAELRNALLDGAVKEWIQH
ncbi:MAG: hypothetical protein Q4C73_01760 [Eubacteriales bacterium]|nr:hypothetical protein [Eubacteriales bacterium]